MTDTITAASLAEKMTKTSDIKVLSSFNFSGCKINLYTNSRKLSEKLHRYYGHFASVYEGDPDIKIYAIEGEPPEIDVQFIKKAPDPGKTKVKEEYADLIDGRVIRKIITGMMFITGKDINIASGNCVLNDNQVINFINNRYIEWMLKSGGLLFHASGVTTKGRGMVISGFSGAGKSTMALNMMNRGIKFVSNDRIIIKKGREGLTMHGVPKLPRVNPGTVLTNPRLAPVIPEEERADFLKVPKDELWNLEHKYDVYIDEIYGKDKFVLSSSMDSIIVLNWKRGERSPVKAEKVDLYRRRDLLPAFMKSTGLFFLEYDSDPHYVDSEEAYLSMLERADAYEITGGINFDEASEILMDILEGEY